MSPVLILFLLNNACLSKEFESQFNFKFNLPEGYEIFNKNNLYDVYNHSNKDPLVKAPSWKMFILNKSYFCSKKKNT